MSLSGGLTFACKVIGCWAGIAFLVAPRLTDKGGGTVQFKDQ